MVPKGTAKAIGVSVVVVAVACLLAGSSVACGFFFVAEIVFVAIVVVLVAVVVFLVVVAVFCWLLLYHCCR